MKFPTSSGQPYLKIDGRTGAFSLSCPDGDPEVFDMSGKLLDLDLNGANQGWLKLDVGVADWVPLATRGEWEDTPQPSADHKSGVSIDVMGRDWPDPKLRQLRGSSRAITKFIARIAEAAGDIPNGKAVRVRITGAKAIKCGKGSSVDIGFEMAPRDAWPDVTTFDDHRGDTTAGDVRASAFSGMKDSPLDGSADTAADWQ
jgi:hypothetical protein